MVLGENATQGPPKAGQGPRTQSRAKGKHSHDLPPDRRRSRYLQRLQALKDERSSWVTHWQQVSDMILPRRGRFLTSDRNRGGRRNRKIIDNTATMALRTLASGLMSGVTSPARPWFHLAPQMPQLIEDGEVKKWTSMVETILREIFNRSNVYNTLFSVYEELAAFGTAAMLVYENFDTVISCETLTVGQYCVAPSKSGHIETLYREQSLTVTQVVEEFVETAPNQFDWSRVSSAVRQQWENNVQDAWVDVVQVIEPNPLYKGEPLDGSPLPGPLKKFRSVWFEAGGASDGGFLRESGFDEFPAMCPRWNLAGADIYGTSPAMDALGDVEQLQVEEKEKSKAVQKMVSPPLTAPSTMRTENIINPLPDGITFYDPQMGSAPTVGPLYQVQPRVAELQQDMEVVRGRIRESFYADLWRMISDMDRSGVTATEIDARREEKLLMLGPVLERLHHELLDPLIDRAFAIALRAGILPDPPEALSGSPLRVEYISMLAQAQRAVAIGGIERVVSFVGNLAQAVPTIMDKLDADQAVDEVSNAIGAPPQIVRSDKDVAQIRQQRAQAQQQQQQQEQQQALLQQAPGMARDLSQADTGGKNALTDLMNTISGGV